MLASMSRSMPAQKALPAPVMMTTREWLFSTASRADCNSDSISGEIALRFSARFSVIVATSWAKSSFSVSSMAALSSRSTVAENPLECAGYNLILIHQRRVCILGANLVGHGQDLRQFCGIDSRIGARFSQCGEDILGGDVSDRWGAREGAAAKASQRAIEPAAASFVRGKNLFFGLLGATVQMYAQLDSGDVIFHLAVEVADEGWFRRTDRVRQRNRANLYVFKPFECFGDDFRSPRLIVRIAEGHRNVNHQAAIGRFGFFVQFFNQQARLRARHVGIGPAEIRGDRVRIADRRNTRSSQRPLQSFFIHDDADNFRRIRPGRKRWAKLRHDV